MVLKEGKKTKQLTETPPLFNSQTCLSMWIPSTWNKSITATFDSWDRNSSLRCNKNGLKSIHGQLKYYLPAFFT